MLKCVRRLLLVAVVVIANVYVPPTYAASANLIISHIQAGGSGAALQELVILYNNSSEPVDITGWCVRNKNNVELGCYVPEYQEQKFFLAGRAYATIGSADFANTHPDNPPGIIYEPANYSSGSITGGADTISLYDQNGTLVDQHSWSTSLAGGSALFRQTDSVSGVFIDTDGPSDWKVGLLEWVPSSSVIKVDNAVDVCANIDGMQITLPLGYEVLPDAQCFMSHRQLYITELLPNAKGSDTGNEFIEIYNPNEEDVWLDNYVLQIGPDFENQQPFPMASFVPAKSYTAFTNDEIDFGLLNSSSRVRLVSMSGVVIDETPSYQDPADDMAWALIDREWKYVKPATPGAPNDVVSPLPTLEETTQQPCAANQYRSPETNRCRLIATTTTPAPCKDGQYRSEETNRCRNIAADAAAPKPCEEGEERNPETGRCRKIAVATVPAPCKAGQERNPETNRCRNIVSMTKADYAVLGTQTSSSGTWYVWAAIIGLILAALGYAVWEWRYEIKKLLAKLLLKFVRKPK